MGRPATSSEVVRALDELDLDGAILSSKAGGAYPGGPEYDAVLAELNRRRATVLFHAWS